MIRRTSKQVVFRKSAMFSVSVLALCIAAPAYADCTPDPAPAGETIICSGTDADGLIVNAAIATVTVQQNADVDRLVLTNPAPAASGQVFVSVAGTITNGLTIGSKPGALFPPSPYPATETVSLTVSKTGRLNGVAPILFQASVPGGPFGPRAWIDYLSNEGEIRTTIGSGPAIFASDFFSNGIGQLNNSSTGFIGGINANFRNLDNRGVIDGGQNSAISTNGSLFFQAGPIFLSNSGTITNNSANSTIRSLNPGGAYFINNSGLISNAGSGAAIQNDSPNTQISNTATGQIVSAGGAAITGGLLNFWIRNAGVITGNQDAIKGASTVTVNLANDGVVNGSVSSGDLILLNKGTINGNVIATSSSVVNASNVTLANGSRINGDLRLGNGDDILIIDYANGNPLSSLVSGTIDGGGGINSLYQMFAQDSVNTLSTGVIMPATFQKLVFSAKPHARIELAPGFLPNGTLTFRTDPNYDPYAGAGIAESNYTLVNNANLSFSGPVFDIAGAPFFSADFLNQGTVSASLGDANQFAVSHRWGRVFNSGLITAVGGNGLRIQESSLENTGSIIADYLALRADFGAKIRNLGLIKSNLGTGVALFSSGSTFQNDGTISGKTIAVDLHFAELFNNGMISSEGTAIRLHSTSGFENAAGGIVIGGKYAITSGQSAIDFSPLVIRNAGRIVGDVNLSNASGLPTGNMFYALQGGVINGDLLIGNGGDRLIVDAAATGRLAGVTGAILAGPDTSLEYLVSRNLTTQLAPSSNLFSSIGYGLLNGATLTLKGPAPSNQPYFFEGEGSVILNAKLSGDGSKPLISVRQGTEYPFSGLINFTTQSSITGSRSAAGASAGPLISLEFAQFTNDGTITVRDNRGVDGDRMIGIFAAGNYFGPDMTNNGRIRVGGGIGVANDAFSFVRIINNGVIEQLSGAPVGIGVLNPYELINNGTISTDGTAVVFGNSAYPNAGAGTVTNSGLIKSTKGIAILDQRDFGYAAVYNGAAGIIEGGGGKAIRLDNGGFVQNEGKIDGDVELGWNSVALFPSGFDSLGGTLKGNLRLGAGDDVLRINASSGGITGFADGGDGIDGLILSSGDSIVRNYDLGRFRNFEHLALSGNGEFSFRNAPVFHDISITYTKLLIGHGQSLRAVDQFAQEGGQTQVDGTLNAQGIGIYGGLLNGSGMLNAVGLYSFGSLIVPKRNGEIGVLTVKADVELTGGSVLLVDIGAATNDRFVVRSNGNSLGTLTLSSAHLGIELQGSGPRFGNKYKIVTADGGINGMFASVQGGQIGVLSPVVAYNTNDITVTFQASSLAAQLPSGASSVQLAFANALDALRGSSYTNLSSLYSVVDLMGPGSLNLTLGALNPTIASEATAQYRNETVNMVDRLSARAARLGSEAAPRGSWSMSGAALATGLIAASAPLLSHAATRLRLSGDNASTSILSGTLPEHMSGFIDAGVNEAQAVQGDVDLGERGGRRNWRMAMGLEMDAAENLVIGTAVGMSQGESNIADGNSQVRTSQAAAYAKLALGNHGYLTALGSMATSRISTERSSFDELGATQLRGAGTALSINTQLEAGYALPVAKGISLSPHVSLRYSAFHLNNLGERGGVSALQMSNIGENRFEARVGARLEGRTSLGNGWNFVPQLQARWVQALKIGDGVMTARFSAADTLAFALPFGSTDTGWGEMQGGIELSNGAVSFGASIKSAIGRSDLKNNRASAEFGLRF
jgi:hypothetical protein